MDCLHKHRWRQLQMVWHSLKNAEIWVACGNWFCRNASENSSTNVVKFFKTNANFSEYFCSFDSNLGRPVLNKWIEKVKCSLLWVSQCKILQWWGSVLPGIQVTPQNRNANRLALRGWLGPSHKRSIHCHYCMKVRKLARTIKSQTLVLLYLSNVKKKQLRDTSIMQSGWLCVKTTDCIIGLTPCTDLHLICWNIWPIHPSFMSPQISPPDGVPLLLPSHLAPLGGRGMSSSDQCYIPCRPILHRISPFPKFVKWPEAASSPAMWLVQF